LQHLLPEGLRDWIPAELVQKRELERRIADVFEQRGYAEIATPTLENTRLLEAAFDQRAGQIFHVAEGRDPELGLRTEMTTPIARTVGARLRAQARPLRLWYLAPVFRRSPGGGQLHEITQAGCEVIGDPSAGADAEALFAADEVLATANIHRVSFDINDATIVASMLREMNCPPKTAERCIALIAARNLVALREIARSEPLDARFDDFLELLFLRDGENVLRRLPELFHSADARSATENLRGILTRANERGMGERVRADLTLLRDLRYYTGFVFEAHSPGLASPLCAGGRYDTLLSHFGSDAPAVGWSLSIENVLEASLRDRSLLRERENRLVLAVPKGALYEGAVRRLSSAGIEISLPSERRLIFGSSRADVDILLLRAGDIPAYVESGAADCGIVGKDTLWESDRAVCELVDLEFGACGLAVAGRRADDYHGGRSFPPFLRVATKYRKAAREYFASRDIACRIIPLGGSVEVGPLVGLADVIVDLVATGKTLREHDLVVIDEIARSSARLIANAARFRTKHRVLADIVSKLEGVPA